MSQVRKIPPAPRDFINERSLSMRLHAVSDSEISLSAMVLVTKIGTKWFGECLALGVLSRLPSLDQRRCTFPFICVLDRGSILQLKDSKNISVS